MGGGSYPIRAPPPLHSARVCWRAPITAWAFFLQEDEANGLGCPHTGARWKCCTEVHAPRVFSFSAARIQMDRTGLYNTTAFHPRLRFYVKLYCEINDENVQCYY